MQATTFVFPDGTPMLHKEFDAALRQQLTFRGIQMSAFKGHSFHIGAATAAALHEESGVQLAADMKEVHTSLPLHQSRVSDPD